MKRTRRKHLRSSLLSWPVLIAANQECVVDFATEVTDPKQRFRVLGVIDSFTRQSHVWETATGFPRRRVTREVERATAEHGTPQAIRCDNRRSEPVGIFWREPSNARSIWFTFSPASRSRTEHRKLQRKLRDECLIVNWYWNLSDPGEGSRIGRRNIIAAVRIARAVN